MTDDFPDLGFSPEDNAEIQRIKDTEGLSAKDAAQVFLDRRDEERDRRNPNREILDISRAARISRGEPVDDDTDADDGSTASAPVQLPDPEVDFLEYLQVRTGRPLMTESQIYSMITEQYLRDIYSTETPLRRAGAQLLIRLGKAAAAENLFRTPFKGKDLSKAEKEHNRVISGMPMITKPKTLHESAICALLLHRYSIVTVDLAQGSGEAKTGLLALYQDAGEHEGLYVTDRAQLHGLIGELHSSATSNFVESTLKTLQYMAPLVTKTIDKRWIPVQNGIFDHQDQILREFTPNLVFLNKSPVRYIADAQEPVITEPDGTQWSPSSWISSLSDDEGVPELLWEVLSAVLRPGERWDQALFLHSSKGNNGKGTFAQLARNLVGKRATASIPMDKFSKSFALASLSHAQAIVTDENPVGAFSKDLGDFKAIVTGDEFTLERKYENPVSLSFQGTVIQCVNDFPKSQDKSASYARRQLFIPFRKWFGGDGVERKYIKSDFLHRAEVLEWILKEALHMQHTSFSQPEACQALLAQFQRENNPVVDFWLEVEDQFVWDLLPTTFLYDLFKAWYAKNHPSGSVMNRNQFLGHLRDYLDGSEEWDAESYMTKKKWPGRLMDAPEMFILDYDLKDWMNPAISNNVDRAKKARPMLAANYRGVLRKHPLKLSVMGQRRDEED